MYRVDTTDTNCTNVHIKSSLHANLERHINCGVTTKLFIPGAEAIGVITDKNT